MHKNNIKIIVSLTLLSNYVSINSMHLAHLNKTTRNLQQTTQNVPTITNITNQNTDSNSEENNTLLTFAQSSKFMQLGASIGYPFEIREEFLQKTLDLLLDNTGGTQNRTKGQIRAIREGIGGIIARSIVVGESYWTAPIYGHEYSIGFIKVPIKSTSVSDVEIVINVGAKPEKNPFLNDLN